MVQVHKIKDEILFILQLELWLFSGSLDIYMDF